MEEGYSFEDACASFGDAAEARLLRDLLPILDEMDIPPAKKQELVRKVEVVKKRFARLPSNDFSQRKEEIGGMLLALKRCSKLQTRDYRTREKNELVREILWSMAAWIKKLWIIGVEFGSELESVHDSLLFCLGILLQWRDMTSECLCMTSALDMKFSIRRSNGFIEETFSGRASTAIPQATRFVWKHLLLTHLAKFQNQEDSCAFVAQRLPVILRDICEMSGIGAHAVIGLIDESATWDLEIEPGGDADTDEDDEDEDVDEDWSDDQNEDDDDDDDDDEGLPPLIDLTDDGIQQTHTSTDGTNMPPLVKLGLSTPSLQPPKSTVAKVPRKPRPVSPPGPRETLDTDPFYESESENDDDDSDGSTSHASGSDKDTSDMLEGLEDEIIDELDDEADQRSDEEDRLEYLAHDFLVNHFGTRPNFNDYFRIIKHLDLIKPKLDRLLTTGILHTPGTFATALRILMRDKNTSGLRLLLENKDNEALIARTPSSMQQVVRYYLSSHQAAIRGLAGPLAMKQVRGLLQAMKVEVETVFRGLRNPAKLSILVDELLNMPKDYTQDQKTAAYKSWVQLIVSPKPESIIVSEEAANIPDDTGPLGFDPFGIFAGLSALFGVHPPSNHAGSSTVYVDPIHELESQLPPGDDDLPHLYEIYRPPYSSLFESWMEVIKEVVAREPHKSGNISFKICLEVTEIFPFIRIKVAGLVEEMKNSVADEGTRDHVSDILTTLSSFVKEQQRLASLQKTKRAKVAAKKAGQPASTVPPPPLGVSTPTQPVTPGPHLLNPPSSNAAAVNVGLNAAPTTPGLNPTVLANLMQMTFPLAVFGFPDDPAPPPQMDDVD